MTRIQFRFLSKLFTGNIFAVSFWILKSKLTFVGWFIFPLTFNFNEIDIIPSRKEVVSKRNTKKEGANMSFCFIRMIGTTMVTSLDGSVVHTKNNLPKQSQKMPRWLELLWGKLRTANMCVGEMWNDDLIKFVQWCSKHYVYCIFCFFAFHIMIPMVFSSACNMYIWRLYIHNCHPTTNTSTGKSGKKALIRKEYGYRPLEVK